MTPVCLFKQSTKCSVMYFHVILLRILPIPKASELLMLIEWSSYLIFVFNPLSATVALIQKPAN